MYEELKRLEDEGRPIQVAIVGCGHQGKGVALQTRLTPGLKLVAAIDKNIDAAVEAASLAEGGTNLESKIVVGKDILPLLEEGFCDVLVDATNSIEEAAQICVSALKNKINVVLTNAELDLLLGPYLNSIAKENGVVITSDAGDQHGVIARMVDEIKSMGFEVVMLGNIKGFLNRYATYEKMVPEAKKRYLDVRQCVAYTDGTKLCVEMSLLANAFDLRPLKRGMLGPQCETVEDVFKRFGNHTFRKAYLQDGCVDYILGAKPGGGVFVVGYCNDPIQRRYLQYYKRGRGPYYLFYRPYHLCHLETPRAIAKTVLFKKRVLMSTQKSTDVYAFAKRDLQKGESIKYAIGGDELYGMIDGRNSEFVPIALLETDIECPVLKRGVRKDLPLTWDDIEIPHSTLWDFYAEQEKMMDRFKSM